MTRQENGNSIKKNYIYNLVYQIMNLIVPLITTPYVSRILLVEGIGQYSYELSIATYFSMFGVLGIVTYGQLKISEVRDDYHQLSVIFWEVLIARVCTMGLAIFVYVGYIEYFSTYRNVAIVILVYLVAQLFDISWFFQGIEDFKKTVTRNIIVKAIGTFLIFVCVKEKSDLNLYILITQGTIFLGNISLFGYLKGKIKFVSFKEVRFWRHWKNCIVYFVPTIATSVYTVLDKSMLGLFLNSALENGCYEQAHKIEQMCVAVVTSLTTVTLPRLRYLHAKNERGQISDLFGKTFRFMIFLSVPMMVGLWSISDSFVPVFLGEGYEGCISLLKIFSLLILIVGADNLIGRQCLMAFDKQSTFNRGVLWGALSNFCLNLLLINILGSNGAAIASVLAECVILFYFILKTYRDIDYRIITKGISKYLFAALMMGVAVDIVGKFGFPTIELLIIQLGIGVGVYLLLLFIFKDEFLLKYLAIVRDKMLRRK